MRPGLVVSVLWVAALAAPLPSSAQDTTRVDLRGKPQTLRLYGPAAGPPVVVTSSDGGWVHLAPRVAELLARRGYSVVGFDAKAYLEAFTSGPGGVRPEDEPHDFAVLAAFAARRGDGSKPILVGVSAGSALSVLAATDPATRDAVRGVIALGLSDRNELAWRWRDALIYITHSVPDEPTFSVRSVVGRVSPLPLAIIQSTRDDFVPPADAEAIFATAREPKRRWPIDARNHAFDGAQDALMAALVEAISWIQTAK